MAMPQFWPMLPLNARICRIIERVIRFMRRHFVGLLI
jgi:hypothetical protein